MDIPKRKLPIKRRWLALEGEWEGWNFEARINSPIKAFGLVSAGEFEKIIQGLAIIILDWDFVDEEGEPMPKPSREAISNLGLDLLTAVSNRYVQELTQVPPG